MKTHQGLPRRPFRLKRNGHSPGVSFPELNTAHASESTAKEEAKPQEKGQSGWARFAFGNSAFL